MKEITLQIADSTASIISTEASEMGLTSAELIKYIVGSWAQETQRERQGHSPISFHMVPGAMMSSFSSIFAEQRKQVLRAAASRGELKCKNCTMPLTSEDVDKGECHSCNAPIEIEGGV